MGGGSAVSKVVALSADFLCAEKCVWREIRRRRWPIVAFEVLGMIVDCSFGMGRKLANIPSRLYFCDYIKQADTHVCTALKWLKERGVIDEPLPGCYRVLTLFGSWRVDELPHDERILEQLHMFGPALDLHDGSIESFLSESARFLVRENLPGVVSGAAVATQPERSAIGDGSSLESVAGNGQGRKDVSGRSLLSDADGEMAAVKLPPSLPGGVPKSIASSPQLVTKSVTEQARLASQEVVQTRSGYEIRNQVTKSVTEPSAPPQTPPARPVKRLTVNRSSLIGTAASGEARPGGARRPLVTYAESKRLMEAIEEFVGPADMELWGADFRIRGVWNFPDLVEEAVATGRMLANEGYKFRNRGAWLRVKIAQLAGIGSLGNVSPGPKPQV